jgi:hypothetical protein
MLSRMKIAEFFESRALAQVGITPQRLGQVTASESATGTQQAVSQSYAQTESYFTRFSEYKKRTLKMNLDIAQYVQSKEKDVTVSYVKSDMSRAFLKLNGTELLLADLHCYVTNSQEDVRQLETLRQLFMTNNNMGASPADLATVIMSNSPAEIKAQLNAASERQQQQIQQQQEIDQQKIQTQRELAQAKMEFDAEQNALDRETELQKAYIASFSRQMDNTTDEDGNGIADLLEYERFALEADAQTHAISADKSKEQLEKQKLMTQKEMQVKELTFKQKELEAKERMNRDNNRTALKNKVTGEKKKVAAKKK